MPTALCLPAPDIAALIQGRIIAAIPRMFIRPGQKFALYPSSLLSVPISIDKYYCSNFLAVAQSITKQSKSQQDFTQPQQLKLIPEDEQLQLPLSTEEKVLIQAYAQCELSQIFDESQSLEKLSRLTIWTQEALEKILHQQQHIFLSYLRVYKLSQPYEVSLKVESKKLGKFVGLPNSLRVSDTNPILTDQIFATRKTQLEKLEPPLHPELEELLAVLSPLSLNNLAAKKLEENIQIFLGWNTSQVNPIANSELDWTNNIAALGNRSKQEDKGKTNYQAGTDFENIVRQSLEFLGFTVDYFHKGGAGGVDLFCSHPYPLVGECKSGKKIPNDTAVQLLNLGTLRLQSQELLKQATKLIIGPGKPTTQLKDAAKVHGMAVINPETLEKLVKLQSKYPNSIDLFKLQYFLKAGQSDAEVEKYIVIVETEIKLRSHLIQIVKKHKENTGDKNIEVATLYGAYGYSNPPKSLSREEMYEILIELSSPLTGYLGRIKGTDWKSDKFYFLRDLAI
ncbi:MAG: DUF1802 family protein [Rivularia sp. (in: cyanobacteria)]